MTEQTILDRIEIVDDGTLQIRFALLSFDGGETIARAFHRTCIPPGVDAAKQLALVNADLLRMGKTIITAVCEAKVFAAVQECHTPETLERYAIKMQNINGEKKS